MVFRRLGFALALPCLLALALAACRDADPGARVQAVAEDAAAVGDAGSNGSTGEGGAISTAPVKATPGRPPAAEPPPRRDRRVDWSPLTLESGKAWISCELDYTVHDDGAELASLERDALVAALNPCKGRGVLRLRFQGRIASDFTALVERVTRLADRLDIGKRVLDIDSTGGMVEEAIRTGDLIAGSRWAIWVREGSLCHSACVFVLAAGDNRTIAGQVGIHRIIRMSSTATTRAELNAELQVVYVRVRDYLERNGAAVAVASLMMAVPNRNLRLLSDEELQLFGLDGVNAAQDDLDRLRLMRHCGEDFVQRRDAFARAFDRRCRHKHAQLDALNDCGLALRGSYGFPDLACPAESPLSEFDLVQADPEPKPEPGAQSDATSAATPAKADAAAAAPAE